jgi:gliding motility-associated-like protein
MLTRYIQYLLFSIICMCGCTYCAAQSGFGAPVFYQDFGVGNNDPATIGIPLPSSKSDFTFSNSVCPLPGSYTIIRRVPVASCFNSEWIQLTHDADPQTSFGMMMVVNNNMSAVSRTIYRDTITTPLCPGELYYCSAYLINLDENKPCPSGTDFPVIELRVETENGVVLTKDTTRPSLGYASNAFGYKFTDMGIYFYMPGGVNKLVVKMTLLPSFGACAEDFAIDAIGIKSVGPGVAIKFPDEPNTTIIKSVCFQSNSSISLTGNMDDYYPNPVLQWQQSTDSGAIWTDIPGANANPNCRVISNVLRVRVDGLPSNYVIKNNSPVCAGQPLQFNAEGAASYEWNGPNNFYDIIPYPSIYKTKLADSGWYHVQVKSLGGCIKEDSVYAKIIGTDVHGWPDTVLCAGNTVRLNVNEGVSYLWSPAATLSSATVKNPTATPLSTTNYIVKLTDSYGCSDTSHVLVQVKNKIPVKALFDNNNYLCPVTDSIKFTDNSEGIIKSWLWNFGNGFSDTVKNPLTQYYSVNSSTSQYLVSLKVTDTSGCVDELTKWLQVVPMCNIAVPNAFTPNNDGLNDYLFPLNAYKATNLSFRVYNRTGQLVFQGNDLTKKWDGKINNIEQPAGVYVWVLDYLDVTGKRIFQKGTTLLIR